MPIVQATEYEICVSITDLVTWSEGSDDARENEHLQAIFSALGGTIRLVPLYQAYSDDEDRAGRGDVHVYSFNDTPSTVVVIDTYNDPTDQLDLIAIYIRCTRSASEEIARLISVFFNRASVQVHASQQSVSTRLRSAVDSSRFPLPMGQDGFVQRQIHHTAV